MPYIKCSEEFIEDLGLEKVLHILKCKCNSAYFLGDLQEFLTNNRFSIFKIESDELPEGEYFVDAHITSKTVKNRVLYSVENLTPLAPVTLN